MRDGGRILCSNSNPPRMVVVGSTVVILELAGWLGCSESDLPDDDDDDE